MPTSKQRKGFGVERRIVKAMDAVGVPARRMPLSGSGGGQGNNHDVEISVVPEHDPFKVEIKARKDGSGWKTMEGWLGDLDLLVMMEDRKSPLVAMRWNTFLEIAKALNDDSRLLGRREAKAKAQAIADEEENEAWSFS